MHRSTLCYTFQHPCESTVVGSVIHGYGHIAAGHAEVVNGIRRKFHRVVGIAGVDLHRHRERVSDTVISVGGSHGIGYRDHIFRCVEDTTIHVRLGMTLLTVEVRQIGITTRRHAPTVACTPGCTVLCLRGSVQQGIGGIQREVGRVHREFGTAADIELRDGIIEMERIHTGLQGFGRLCRTTILVRHRHGIFSFRIHKLFEHC